MPIKVACRCGQKFAAKDALAGKTVKCPKCGQPLLIPAGESAAAAKPARPQSDPLGGGLDDLLDEVGVAPQTAGPRCPSCGGPIRAGALLCTGCGFNLQTGERLMTMAGPGMPGEMSHAEQLVARAAKEIAETPVTRGEGDYGEGTNPMAYVLAFFLPALFCLSFGIVFFWGIFLIAPHIALVLAAIISGAFIVLVPVSVGLTGVIVMMVGWFRLLFAALDEHLAHGLLSLTTGLYAIVFGIIYFKKHGGSLITFGAGALLFMVSIFLWILLGIGAVVAEAVG